MKAKLITHRGIYYLYLDEETIVPMRTDNVKNFLRNYSEDSYYENLINQYSVPALKRKFSDIPTVLAIVEEDNVLTIKDPTLISRLFSPQTESKFISTEDFAVKHGKKRAIVLRMCREGRIDGARLINSVWVIPSDAPYPEDGRKSKGMKCVNPSLAEQLNYSPPAPRARTHVKTTE